MKVYFYNGQITNYSITTEGKLYNEKTKNWLKGQISKNGYLTYNISIEGIKKRLYAHRMVAETYIPFIEGKTEVNHIDGNKLNNSVENLEWVNSKENLKHAVENGLIDAIGNIKNFNGYKINQIKDGRIINTFDSISKASKITGVCRSGIEKVINGKQHTSGGYYWKRCND